MVPRRRRVRRRGAAVRAGRRARPRPRARRSRHGRPAQVVLPGVRPGRAARARRRATCGRRSTARPSTTAAARRPRARATPARHDDAHAGQLNFYKLGFEGTRRFRALKLWASWQHLGTAGLGRLVETNVDVAAYLAALCREADDLETVPAEPELSVVCFRHLPGGSAAAAAMDAARPRRPPGPARGRARGVRRRLAVDDDPARLDVPARRRRQLPDDRGRHRPAPRDPPAPRERLNRQP